MWNAIFIDIYLVNKDDILVRIQKIHKLSIYQISKIAQIDKIFYFIIIYFFSDNYVLLFYNYN